MKHLRILFHTFVLTAAVSSFGAETSQFYLKDGDRVVFYGDSITDQRLYTTFVETYAVTRFPKMNVQFVHSGVGGDRVGGGWGGPIDTRLERDVFAYKPTVMTIMLGMNDGSYTNFFQKIFDQYSKGYEHIVASVKQHFPNIRLTLIQPSPYDDVTRPPVFAGGYNQVLVRYGEFVKELGARNGATVADLNAPVVTALEKAYATDTNVAAEIIGDRIHPGAAGHLLMASELLKAWHAPSLVSAVEVDASGKIATGTGTRVSNLKSSRKVSWTQTDAALPFPIATNDAVMVLAVRSSDVVDALDKQIVKVTGLEGDFYTLTIDGGAVQSFSRQQLADGVNIALLQTPMFKQAAEVHKLTIEHNNLHFARWRNIQMPMHEYNKRPKVVAAMKALLKTLDEEEAVVLEKRRQIVQPRPHDFELIPVSRPK